jgi:hypothetical protein
MITIFFPPSFTKALGAVNDRPSISTTESTMLTATTELNIQSLTQWVLDETTNTLYAISQENKILYFINAVTMKIEKSLILDGGPTDIIKDSGKLYIALNDINQITVVDMASRVITKMLSTSSDPYRIVIDGNKLYYAERDQWCEIYAYDLTTNTDKALSIGTTYKPDLAINTDKHILYIGESGISRGEMIYYSTIDNIVVDITNYDNGYGSLYYLRYTLFDGTKVYYAGIDFTVDNPRRCIGDFGGNVIFAKNNFAFTNTSIYDATSHVKLGDYGSNMDLVEATGNTIYLYSRTTGSIKRFNNLNSPINSNNIISFISGTPAVPIQSDTKSVLVDPNVYSLKMNSELTQWILDENTNTLYGISNRDKALFFINATTLNIEKSITFTSGPTDIIMEKGKLYVALDNVNQIAIVDMLSRKTTEILYTSSDPYRIVIDGNKLYYAERDQWCDIYVYDLTTNTDKTLTIGRTCNPDLAINTDKHILYLGESGSTGSNMIYYSTIDNSVIDTTNYNNDYGFPNPSRYTLFDGTRVYYAGRDFTVDNPRRYFGSFGGNIIFAKNNFAFTDTSIYDATSHVKLGDYGTNMDLVEATGNTIYLYSKTTGSIKRFNNLNSPINSDNIISCISGTPAVPIQSDTKSVLLQPNVYSLEMNSELTQWILDENTNALYGISNKDKALFFINATTLNIEKSITFTSGPTDIIMEKGKLYVALDDVNQIAIVDMLSRKTTEILYTSSDPYRIVIDGNKLYYAERDQWCDIYVYDLTTNTDKALAAISAYYPDLAINTDKHILYIGESNSTGSDMIYYSTIDNEVIGATYDYGYGFSGTQRNVLFDGSLVYYAGRDFDSGYPNVTGSYGANVIFAKYGLAFTNTSVYDSYTNELLIDYGVQLDLVEFSTRTDLYLYNIENKSILKIEPDKAPPVVNYVSPNTSLIKGGTVVNITGTGFTGATEVYFGSNLGSNLTVNSDTSITVTAPPASGIGTVDIIIVGPNGTNVISSSDRFTYITGLTVNVTATNGSINGLLQGYNYGDTVTLTAVAAEGYTFKNWTDRTGTVLSTDQVYSFEINDNLEIDANFVDSCDANKDGRINVSDLNLVAENYNMKSSDISWDSNLDFNKDGIIDIFDLVFCSNRTTD